MSNIDKQAGAGDVIPKTYYIHPAAFGSTQDPGHGHVPVFNADDFEKLRTELEAAEKCSAEQKEIIAKQEKWIKDVEATLISATDRAEAAEKRVAELEAREPDLYLCRVTRDGEELYSPCGRDYPRGRGYIAAGIRNNGEG